MATAMEIIWLGHSSFLIRGKSIKVVTDPFDPKLIGMKFTKTEGDIVTISHDHPDHNQADLVKGEGEESPFVIFGPGEYEVKGVSVFGVATYHDEVGGSKRGKNTVYVIEIDGVKICHLGDLGHKLTDGQLTEIGDVDVLLIPVGGFFTIDAKVASEVVGQLEPRFVIPMHYKIPGLNKENFGEINGVDLFLTEMGSGTVTPIPKLVVTKDKLPEQVQVVLLERKV
jgi:L-ascorbate metabolism protein UlaG (beta-lactamase superfamily)